MARLLGQLGVATTPDIGMQLLQKAAVTSSVESPHPAYVYELLLLGEFTAAKVDAKYYVPLIPQGTLSSISSALVNDRPQDHPPQPKLANTSNVQPTWASHLRNTSSATPTNTPSHPSHSILYFGLVQVVIMLC